MKFMGEWHNTHGTIARPIRNILSELKIKQAANKIYNYRNEWIQI